MFHSLSLKAYPSLLCGEKPSSTNQSLVFWYTLDGLYSLSSTQTGNVPGKPSPFCSEFLTCIQKSEYIVENQIMVEQGLIVMNLS
ncbi:MAG: hypothetical protein Kow0077_24470 [Anaerolineae bacterium]